VGGIQTYSLELARRLVQWCKVLEVIAPMAPGAAHGRELLLRPVARLRLAQRLYDVARRRVLRGADGIFAVSRYTAGLARGLGVDPGRIHVVPNGVDAARLDLPDAAERSRRFRERHGLVGRPCFVTVARLQPHKGIDTGIAALPALRRHVPGATYVVVGDGPDAERLRGLAAQLGVSESVRMLGRVSDDDVVDALLACDAFALLSRETASDVEGFGLVLLEAGACGKPVLGGAQRWDPGCRRRGRLRALGRARRRVCDRQCARAVAW
jgi:phosphatidyl-myo-inositol dimannoside synthase